MKTARLQDINRTLGDLVNEAPYLSVEHGESKGKFYVYSLFSEEGIALIARAEVLLRNAGFIFKLRGKNGNLYSDFGADEIIITGRA